MTRYDWWGYVKGMIRRYPALSAEHDALMEQGITVNYDAIGHSTEASRTVEEIAIRGLPTTHEREYWAVRHAIETTQKLNGGGLRLAIIDCVFFRGSHTLTGAAVKCHVSTRTARRYHTEFIRLVASYYGLMD